MDEFFDKENVVDEFSDKENALNAFFDASARSNKTFTDLRLKPYLKRVLYIMEKGFRRHNLYHAFDVGAFLEKYMFSNSSNEYMTRLMTHIEPLDAPLSGQYNPVKNQIFIAERLFGDDLFKISKESELDPQILSTLTHEFCHFLTKCGTVTFVDDSGVRKEVSAPVELLMMYHRQMDGKAQTISEHKRIKEAQKKLETSDTLVSDFTLTHILAIEEALTERFATKMLGEEKRVNTSYTPFIKLLNLYETIFDITDTDISYLRRNLDIYIQKSHFDTFASFALLAGDALDAYCERQTNKLGSSVVNAEQKIMQEYLKYLDITKQQLSISDFAKKSHAILGFLSPAGSTSEYLESIKNYAEYCAYKEGLDSKSVDTISKYAIRGIKLNIDLELAKKLNANNIVFLPSSNSDNLVFAAKDNNVHIHVEKLINKNDMFNIPLNSIPKDGKDHEIVYEDMTFVLNRCDNDFKIDVYNKNTDPERQNKKTYDVTLDDSLLTVKRNKAAQTIDISKEELETKRANYEPRYTKLVSDLKKQKEHDTLLNKVNQQRDEQPLLLR